MSLQVSSHFFINSHPICTCLSKVLFKPNQFSTPNVKLIKYTFKRLIQRWHSVTQQSQAPL